MYSIVTVTSQCIAYKDKESTTNIKIIIQINITVTVKQHKKLRTCLEGEKFRGT